MSLRWSLFLRCQKKSNQGAEILLPSYTSFTGLVPHIIHWNDPSEISSNEPVTPHKPHRTPYRPSTDRLVTSTLGVTTKLYTTVGSVTQDIFMLTINFNGLTWVIQPTSDLCIMDSVLSDIILIWTMINVKGLLQISPNKITLLYWIIFNKMKKKKPHHFAQTIFHV